jgi:hypothetical protein
MGKIKEVKNYGKSAKDVRKRVKIAGNQYLLV